MEEIQRISKLNDRSESIKKKKQNMKKIKRHLKIILKSSHLMKEINIHLTTISEVNRKKMEKQQYFKGHWKSSRMNRRPRIQETLKVPRRINKKEIHIQTHHMKLQNAKGKEGIFKTRQRRGVRLPVKEQTIRLFREIIKVRIIVCRE